MPGPFDLNSPHSGIPTPRPPDGPATWNGVVFERTSAAVAAGQARAVATGLRPPDSVPAPVSAPSSGMPTSAAEALARYEAVKRHGAQVHGLPVAPVPRQPAPRPVPDPHGLQPERGYERPPSYEEQCLAAFQARQAQQQKTRPGEGALPSFGFGRPHQGDRR